MKIDTWNPRRVTLAVAAAFAGWTAILLRHLLRSPATSIAPDVGDPVLNAAILQWNATTLPLSAEWWAFPAFAPASGVTAFTEHLLGLWPFASPVVWLTGQPVLAYNVVLFLSFPLSGVAMFALVRRLTGSVPAAVVAGAAFAFSPYRAVHLSHLQMLMTFGMPLALLGLHAYVVEGRRAGLVAVVAGWLAASLSNGYFLVFFAVYAGAWLLWFGSPRDRIRRAGISTAVIALASLPLVPLLFTYFRIHRQYGFARGLDEIRAFSADLAGLVAASPLAPAAARVAAGNQTESALYPGLAAIALGGIGVALSMPARAPEAALPYRAGRWFAAAALFFAATGMLAALVDLQVELPLGLRVSLTNPVKPWLIGAVFLLLAWLSRPRPRAAVAGRNPIWFYAMAAVLMLLLSLGPDARYRGETFMTGAPYSWLLALPGVSGLRVPARFWMLGVMSLSVLAGFGVAALARNGRRQTPLIAGAAIAAILAEGWMAVVPLPIHAPPEAPRGVTLIDWPLGEPADDAAAQLAAVTGGYRVVNGYSGYRPPHYWALERAMSLRDGDVLRFLRRLGPLHISIPATDATGLVDWVTEIEPKAERVRPPGGHHLYLLPALPAAELPPPATTVPVKMVGASCNAPNVGLAADNDLSTRWECGVYSQGQRLVADAGGTIEFAGITMALANHASDFPIALRVELSESGGDPWITVWEGLTLAATVQAALEDPVRVDVTLRFPPHRGRYVSVTQTADPSQTGWTVGEFRVLVPAR